MSRLRVSLKTGFSQATPGTGIAAGFRHGLETGTLSAGTEVAPGGRRSGSVPVTGILADLTVRAT